MLKEPLINVTLIVTDGHAPLNEPFPEHSRLSIMLPVSCIPNRGDDLSFVTVLPNNRQNQVTNYHVLKVKRILNTSTHGTEAEIEITVYPPLISK